MPYAINDRVRRREAAGENNDETTTATVVDTDGPMLGLNYDERDAPGIVHGWWRVSAVEPITD